MVFGNGSSGYVNEMIEGKIVVDEWEKNVQLKILEDLPTDIVLGLDSLSIFEVYFLLSKYADERDVSDVCLFSIEEEVDLFPIPEEETDFQVMVQRSIPEVEQILNKFKGVFKIGNKSTSSSIENKHTSEML